MIAPTSLPWFARHELNLAWRDWIGMMSAGRPERRAVLTSIFVVAAVVLHAISYALIGGWAKKVVVPDTETLIGLSAGGVIFFTVMLSQAMESVTRAFYARADLDLILSSPASSRRLFAVRTAAIALTTVALACFLAGPAINVLAIVDGAHWLAAYPVLVALSALATALAIAITVGLFKLVGAKRTRFISQILAAIIGAGFIISLQIIGILAYGNFSRFSFIQSDWLASSAPPLDSFLWVPAQAAMGNGPALVMVLTLGAGLLAGTIFVTASSFAKYAIAAAGLSHAKSRAQSVRKHFQAFGQKRALRAKEWQLLRRDPWLLSQTLMQILYLLPPAVMLWVSFGQDNSVFIVIIPVLVMASGQLAGGLAWLAISGEDAHDLVASAPIRPRDMLIAKIQSVLVVIAVIVSPLLVFVALSTPHIALIAAVGCLLSAGSATIIQIWFRTQARRSLFGRRQISSRVATLSEAFASILWAGTAAVFISMPVLAILPAILAIAVMGLAYALSPKES